MSAYRNRSSRVWEAALFSLLMLVSASAWAGWSGDGPGGDPGCRPEGPGNQPGTGTGCTRPPQPPAQSCVGKAGQRVCQSYRWDAPSGGRSVKSSSSLRGRCPGSWRCSNWYTCPRCPTPPERPTLTKRCGDGSSITCQSLGNLKDSNGCVTGYVCNRWPECPRVPCPPPQRAVETCVPRATTYRYCVKEKLNTPNNACPSYSCVARADCRPPCPPRQAAPSRTCPDGTVQACSKPVAVYGGYNDRCLLRYRCEGYPKCPESPPPCPTPTSVITSCTAGATQRCVSQRLVRPSSGCPYNQCSRWKNCTSDAPCPAPGSALTSCAGGAKTRCAAQSLSAPDSKGCRVNLCSRHESCDDQCPAPPAQIFRTCDNGSQVSCKTASGTWDANGCLVSTACDEYHSCPPGDGDVNDGIDLDVDDGPLDPPAGFCPGASEHPTSCAGGVSRVCTGGQSIQWNTYVSPSCMYYQCNGWSSCQSSCPAQRSALTSCSVGSQEACVEEALVRDANGCSVYQCTRTERCFDDNGCLLRPPPVLSSCEADAGRSLACVEQELSAPGSDGCRRNVCSRWEACEGTSLECPTPVSALSLYGRHTCAEGQGRRSYCSGETLREPVGGCPNYECTENAWCPEEEEPVCSPPVGINSSCGPGIDTVCVNQVLRTGEDGCQYYECLETGSCRLPQRKAPICD